ncbi:MAG: HAMP domain-containing protein [Deltaproteobacteria bacterium]|nr:HAMP domain-containing protein [Deltaproteobacteria bacterium]
MSVTAFVMFFWWDSLRTVWPMAFVPLFITGVYAVHRAGRLITDARRATLAGGVAGLAAAVVTVAAIFLLAILGTTVVPSLIPLWSLAPVLLDSPFFIPPNVLFFELPRPLPFPWVFNLTPPGGVLVSRIPWTLPLFLPLGALLAALQAWLYYALGPQTNLGSRTAEWIARKRVSFQTKLLVGFFSLGVMIFVVGWLGWAVTEEMHFHIHAGRVRQHLLDHVVRVQDNHRVLSEAISRLSTLPNDAAIQEVSTVSKRIAAELAHLKTFPPPAHPAEAIGAIRRSLFKEVEKRLPAVREADSRFGNLNKATTRLIELYRSGNAGEARALLASLGPLQRAAEASLWELINGLNAAMVQWVADLDSASHVELFVVMFLVLFATGIAFPLGYVFSQVVVRPVNEVDRGLDRVGSGDFSTQVQVENRDELGELAEHVNKMSAELDRLYAELRVLNENLQQKVNEQLREIERARELKRYLSPQVADSIIAGQSDVKLATTRKNLTVCFADIRGFTGIAERMEPEELIDLLNEYFAAQTEIVFNYGGTLDKYYGDGMMVFFGDPIPYADHAERAVRMALEMKRKLPELEKRWFMRQEERLNIGIGISTGYVTVGNIGSPARLDYTVIGNNVNLASRLADSAAPGQILVTERTMVQIQEIVEAREHGERMVEGAARPVRIYEVLDTRLPSV